MVAASVSFPEKPRSEPESEVWVTWGGELTDRKKWEIKEGKIDAESEDRDERSARRAERICTSVWRAVWNLRTEYGEGRKNTGRERRGWPGGRGSSPLPRTLPWKSSPSQEFSHSCAPSGMPSHFLCLPRRRAGLVGRLPAPSLAPTGVGDRRRPHWACARLH